MGVINVWELKGVNCPAVVGIALEKFGRPLGLSLVWAELNVVEMMFGEEVAAFDAMLLKKESYPI